MNVVMRAADQPPYAKMIDNWQFFTAVKDGKPVGVFLFDHTAYNNATALLSSDVEHPFHERETYDYVRSSYVAEVEKFFDLVDNVEVTDAVVF